MSLFRTVAKFASSPQGRRALQQAKQRIDTPENRQKLSDTVSKVRSSRTRRYGDSRPPASES